MTGAFWVYVNEPNNKAMIHHRDCSFCNDGSGLSSEKLDFNGRWLGPFSAQEAEAAAKSARKANTRWCWHCRQWAAIDRPTPGVPVEAIEATALPKTSAAAGRITSAPHAITDSAITLRGILRDTLRLMSDWCAKNAYDREAPAREWPSLVRDAWLASLRDAFQVAYPGQANYPRFEVYGGKPRHGEVIPKPNARSVSWNRWEFLYDIAVVEVEKIQAAYHTNEVSLVTRARWIVESEIASDGSQVAEDASKLRIGAAACRLLIASQTSQRDPDAWLQFLGKLSRDIDGEWYLALITSYAPRKSGQNSARQWSDQEVDLRLYRCNIEGSVPDLVDIIEMPRTIGVALAESTVGAEPEQS